MKSSPSNFQSVADSVHMARQMQGNSSNASSTSTAAQALLRGQLHSESPSLPLGSHMQDQFEQHVASATDHFSGKSRKFVDQAMSCIGQECTQILLLKARVAFTELAETSMDEGHLHDLEKIVKHTRSLVIDLLSQDHPEDVRNTLNALQVLLQEQQYTAASLAGSSDVGGLWLSEMRFYMKPGGGFECHCVGHSATVNPDAMDRTNDTILVTTHITKEARKAFFHAAFGGADVLLVDGVAGTGKTETCKDICHMLARTPVVLNAGGTQPLSISGWLEFVQPGNVIIVDEADKAPESVIQAMVSAARESHVPLCLSFNSKKSGCDFNEVVGSFCAYVPMEVPHMPIILSSMLACEGLQQADDLGDRLGCLFESLKANCTKQDYYDWGLRKMKSVTQMAGKAARSAAFTEERQMLTAAVQESVACSLSPIDEPIFLRAMLEHFGAEAFVPMPVPADFWNAAATKISRTVASRHASLCLPVSESEEAFVMAVVEEEAAKIGVNVSYMQGRMAELSKFDLIGSSASGEWTDGVFTRALRDLVSREQPGWLVVFCGDVKDAEEKWQPLHTLTDGNKCLRLDNDEVIRLRPDDRIIFAAPSLEGASPATVSRLGVINLESNRRHRL